MESELHHVVDQTAERATEVISSVAGAVADPKTAAKKVKARAGKWAIAAIVVVGLVSFVAYLRSRSS